MDIEPVNSGSFSAEKSDILKYLSEKYKLAFSGSKSEVIDYLNTNYPIHDRYYVTAYCPILGFMYSDTRSDLRLYERI
jgi:hypothetical protein